MLRVRIVGVESVLVKTSTGCMWEEHHPAPQTTNQILPASSRVVHVS
jgi:hypothetical protein